MAVRIATATDEAIAEAAALLRAGRLVAFPTETVYGLGADATNDKAVAAIYAAKDRPAFNPLIAHVPDLEAALSLVSFDERALLLAQAFWPGPLTLVLPRRDDCPVAHLASAGLDSLAVRVPGHPVALALLRAAAVPLAAPSANRSEEVSPTTARHVAESLGDRIDLILDGGPCRVGLESTVVDLSGPHPALLRPGGLAPETIEALIGPLATAGHGDAPRSPGMTRRHYAPRLPLRMNACCPDDGEALLAFGEAPEGTHLNLSPAGDLVEAAANLFAMLRTLDKGPHRGIAVRPIPDRGLGRAINDRLRRAAAKRE
jgi:L-threonylcarbamoyladenylate synthase